MDGARSTDAVHANAGVSHCERGQVASAHCRTMLFRTIHHTLSHIVLPECVRKCDIMSRTCVNAPKQRPWKGVSTDVQYGGLHCLGSSLGLERPLLLIISPLMLRICHRDCRGFPRTPQRERFGHPRDQPHRVPMHDAGLIYDRLHPNKPAYLNTNKPDSIHS